jgi:hypothetical protein
MTVSGASTHDFVMGYDCGAATRLTALAIGASLGRQRRNWTANFALNDLPHLFAMIVSKRDR